MRGPRAGRSCPARAAHPRRAPVERLLRLDGTGGPAQYNPRVTPEDIFRIVDVTGVIANGLLGGAVARLRGFDAIGFLFLAVASALGGGIMRDVMLAQGPPVALVDPYYVPGAAVGAAIAYLLVLDGLWSRRMLILADVLALGCWAATGAVKALGAGLGSASAIFLGVLTAVGGGVLRDVLAGRTPGIFGGQPLYATVAILSSIVMVVCDSLHHPVWGMALAIVCSAVLGIVARRLNWQLPGAASLTFPRPQWPRARKAR